MKLLSIILFALGMLPGAFADSFGPPEPSAYASPSGRYVLRILPGDSQKKPVAVIFELASDGGGYTKKKEFPLVNRRAPVEACISDSGEVYTFDNWGMMGYDHVAVWYSAEGKMKADFTLAQLFPARQLAEIRDKHSSISSIHWRKGVPWINGPHVIVYDALGGYVSITQGVAEYTPKEER